MESAGFILSAMASKFPRRNYYNHPVLVVISGHSFNFNLLKDNYAAIKFLG